MIKNLRMYLVAGVLACVVTVALVFAAPYMIYSAPVTENVSAFTLTLTSDNPSPHQYENVVFTATLDVDTGSGLAPAGAGKLIHFYQGETDIGTSTTDINGVAVLTVNMTNVGSIHFKAGYLVP